MPRVLVLVGSERAGGFNQTLAQTAVDALSEVAAVEIYPDLAKLPHLREDLDEPGNDEVVDAFRAAVRRSDAVLLITPEYNGGPSSLIKNALDHASRPRSDIPIAGIPAAVIGATPTPGATRGAREALVRGLAIAQAAPIDTSYGVAEAYRHRLGDGYDHEVTENVRAVVTSLLAAVRTAPVTAPR